jgi:hypothetical protein
MTEASLKERLARAQGSEHEDYKFSLPPSGILGKSFGGVVRLNVGLPT